MCNEKCLICSCNLKSKNFTSEGITYYECPSCGHYGFDSWAIENFRGNLLDDKIILAKLKSAAFYYLRTRPKNMLVPVIVKDITKLVANPQMSIQIGIDYIYRMYPNKFSQKIDMIMELLGTEIKEIGDKFSTTYTMERNFSKDDGIEILTSAVNQTIYNNNINIFFIPSKQNEEDRKAQAITIIQYLIDAEYITKEKEEYNNNFTFTVKGWERVDALQRENKKSNTVFIAMSFDTKDQRIVDAEESIKKAIVEAGYVPMIIKDKEHNNFIMDELMYEIRKSAFVITDLTKQNQGAYFEAGYAKGLGKQVIFTCHKSDFDTGLVHFDTKQINTVIWEEKDEFIKGLIRRIEVTVGLNNG